MSDGGIQWWQEAGIQQEYEAYLDATQPEIEMPKISEMTQSKYLKQSDVDGEMVVTITKVGQGNLAKEGEPAEMKWMVRMAEFDKPMVINATNIKRLAKACGSDDTDDWTGKKATLYVDHDVEFGGNIVGGLRFRGTPPTIVTQRPAKQTGGTFDDMPDDVPF